MHDSSTVSVVPELDEAVAAWWASNPEWTPLDRFVSGDVLFRSADGREIFYGTLRGPSFVQFLDGEEIEWRGSCPAEFVEPSQEVAVVYMMQ